MKGLCHQFFLSFVNFVFSFFFFSLSLSLSLSQGARVCGLTKHCYSTAISVILTLASRKHCYSTRIFTFLLSELWRVGPPGGPHRHHPGSKCQVWSRTNQPALFSCFCACVCVCVFCSLRASYGSAPNICEKDGQAQNHTFRYCFCFIYFCWCKNSRP